MKKLLLIVALLLGALQLSAADVSPVQARAAAERFLQSDVKGKNFGAMPAS